MSEQVHEMTPEVEASLKRGRPVDYPTVIAVLHHNGGLVTNKGRVITDTREELEGIRAFSYGQFVEVPAHISPRCTVADLIAHNAEEKQQ